MQVAKILKNSNSALKRRLEDQNHLHTIESEEIQATDGTVVDNQSRLININNQQPLKSDTSIEIGNKGEKWPQTYTLQNSSLDQRDPRYPLMLSSEDKKPLVNHVSLLNRLHTFVQNNTPMVHPQDTRQSEAQKIEKNRTSTLIQNQSSTQRTRSQTSQPNQVQTLSNSLALSVN